MGKVMMTALLSTDARAGTVPSISIFTAGAMPGTCASSPTMRSSPASAAT